MRLEKGPSRVLKESDDKRKLGKRIGERKTGEKITEKKSLAEEESGKMMIPSGLYCFWRLKIFTQTFIRKVPLSGAGSH